MSDVIGPMGVQGSVHDDGWGLYSYIGAGECPSEQQLWRSSESAEPDVIQAHIQRMAWLGFAPPDDNDRSDEVNCVIAHIRSATSGCGTGPGQTMPPDPHPFIRRISTDALGEKTFSFAHNGTLDKDVLRSLITDEWMIENDFIPNTYPEAGCGGEWNGDGWENVIDSELYFFWLLKNILSEPTCDVLGSIQKALSHPGFKAIPDVVGSDGNPIPPGKNFIFSDGSAIWAYRNSNSGEPQYPDWWHSLYWKYENGPIYHYAAVMSQPATTSGWNLLNNNSLVYLPKEGKPFVMENFDNLPGVEMKKLVNGYNWVGFPVLRNNGNTPVPEALTRLTNPGSNITPVTRIDLHSQNAISSWFVGVWDPLDVSYLNSTGGYKILYNDENFTSINLPVSGQRINTSTAMNLETGINWVGYFVPEMQAPSDALPAEVLNNLNSIRAADWFMVCENGEFKIREFCEVGQDEYGECYNLVYGSMYILDMAQPVISFRWNDGSPRPREPFSPPVAKSFTVTQAPDYQPVVIDTIISAEEIVEIGAFEGGVCVGAEVVDGYPVNFKYYGTDVSAAEFQLVTAGNGLARQSGDAVTRQCSKPVRRQYDRGIAYLSLAPAPADNTVQPDNISLLKAYPNPFNPTINLRFDLAQLSRVKINVYDIRGRLVRTLTEGDLNAGTHTFTWNGWDDQGRTLSSGVYFLTLEDGATSIKQKIVYLK